MKNRQLGAGWYRAKGSVRLSLVGPMLWVATGHAQSVQDFLVQSQRNLPNQRVTVRPKAVTAAARSEASGLGYVPLQCAGPKRCPLILYSNLRPDSLLERMADKYGIITAPIGDPLDPSGIDQRLEVLLRTRAVDPDKIAILGGSGTGIATAQLGAQNLDVFSRTLIYTQQEGDPPPRGPEQRNEYYIAGGILEGYACFEHVQRLRDRGYPVKFTLQFRDHGPNYEDYDFMGRWLLESWKISDPAARTAPRTFSEVPRLTSDVVARMTTFWTRFQQLPESIRTVARRAHVREAVVPVGNQRVSTLMTDMRTLAASEPAVAAALTAAGLTAERHDVYRAALFGAFVYASVRNCPRRYPTPAATIESAKVKASPRSPLAQNLAFLRMHLPEMSALSATNMWTTP